MRPDFTHLTILVDRSASMWGYKDIIEKEINKILQDIASTSQYIELTVIYADNEYKIECQNRDLKQNPIQIQIHPRFRTAILDAIGTTIIDNGCYFTSLAEEQRPAKVILIILTDGNDNNSTMFDQAQIIQMIQEQSERYQWHIFVVGTQSLVDKPNNEIAQAFSQIRKEI